MLVLPWVLGFEGVKWYNWWWILCWKQFFGSMIPMEKCIKWGDCKIPHNLYFQKEHTHTKGPSWAASSSGKSSPPLPDLVTHGYNLILSRTLLLSTLKVPRKALWWRALPGRAHPPPQSEGKTLSCWWRPWPVPIRSSCIPHVYYTYMDLRVQVPHVLGWRALLGRAHHPRMEDRDAKVESNCCHGERWDSLKT